MLSHFIYQLCDCDQLLYHHSIILNLVHRLSFKDSMETVNIHQAKTNLSRLLSRVELGEEIKLEWQSFSYSDESIATTRYHRWIC